MNEPIESHIVKLSNIIEKLHAFKALESVSTVRSQMLKEKYKCDVFSKHVLYIIKTTYSNRENILRLFYEFKSQNKEAFRLSSVNNEEQGKFNGILYVGSSASLATRMNQHLGHNGNRVYSLQLNKWFNEVSEVDIITIPVDDAYADILYPLENALWDFYRPLFGKKGTNVNSSKYT